MQSIKTQPNFTGIYRIKNTPTNIKDIEEKVLPMYSYLKKEPVIGFPGENPFVIGFELIKEVVANANNASKLWLEMNAKNHGQTLPDTNTNFLQIISGKKDIQDFLNYLTERIKANENSPLNIFRNFFKTTFAERERTDLPEHLKLLDKAIQIYEKEKVEYQNFTNNKKVVTVSSPQELLTKMLTEK